MRNQREDNSPSAQKRSRQKANTYISVRLSPFPSTRRKEGRERLFIEWIAESEVGWNQSGTVINVSPETNLLLVNTGGKGLVLEGLSISLT